VKAVSRFSIYDMRFTRSLEPGMISEIGNRQS
jgi:hypothetical protein